MVGEVMRPEEVKIATLLLWMCLGITLLTSLWEVPDLQEALMLNLVVYAVSFGTVGLIVFAIWCRKNWARIVCAILMALGMLVTVPAVIGGLASNPVSAVFTVLLAGIQLYAIYLLFTPPSNFWFKPENREA